MRLANKKQKWKPLEKKRNMSGRKKKIVKDVTWKQKKIKWKLRDKVKREKRE